MRPFWKTKPLSAMTRAEFESVCDGCARCCLVKLEDEDTGRIHYTDVACRLLDPHACRCTDYARRLQRVKDCLKITPKTAERYGWLPPSCGYRLLAEGRDLYWWHPLVSGDPETVHAAGISVRGRTAGSERGYSLAALSRRIVRWPRRMPKHAQAKGTQTRGTQAKGAQTRGAQTKGKTKRAPGTPGNPSP